MLSGARGGDEVVHNFVVPYLFTAFWGKTLDEMHRGSEWAVAPNAFIFCDVCDSTDAASTAVAATVALT